MPDPIEVDGRTYRHYADMALGAAFPGPVEDRGSLSPDRNELSLAQTHGVYLDAGGHTIQFIIDVSAAPPGSAHWNFIHEVITLLDTSYDALDADAKDALSALDAVVFAAAPSRSFAQVENSTFFSDTDEFLRNDGSRITAAYSASCIVHDANHCRINRQGRQHWGFLAEAECWRLQLANRVALGLDQFEADHLQGLIDRPEQAGDRMIQPVFGRPGQS